MASSMPQTWTRRRPLPRGDGAALFVGETVARLARQEARTVEVRAAAAAITEHCPPNDTKARVRALFSFVKGAMRYTPDTAGTETLWTPRLHLAIIQREGRTWGDCDDGATLLAALAAGVGVRARVVLASFRPDGRYHHVWTELHDGRHWTLTDPFRSTEAGGVVPRRVKVYGL